MRVKREHSVDGMDLLEGAGEVEEEKSDSPDAITPNGLPCESVSASTDSSLPKFCNWSLSLVGGRDEEELGMSGRSATFGDLCARPR